MIEYFIIFIIIFLLIIYNIIYFSFNYKLLIIVISLIVIFYSNIKYFINSLYQQNELLNADSFYKEIVKKPLHINNDISILLYKIRIFFPYDKKNYKYLLHNADKLSKYINNKSIICNKIYKEKILKYTNRILNAYNSIGHSLPDNNEEYNHLLKELQDLMYSYSNSVEINNINHSDNMNYANNQFYKFLL